MSEVLAPEVPLVGISGGGGASNDGRGGGGGGDGTFEVDGAVEALDGDWPDWTSWRASIGSIPFLLFQVTPVG